MDIGIIVSLAVVALAVVGLLFVRPAREGYGRGRGLRRRFGPEYEHTLARHNGDRKATDHELSERVKRHGKLKERSLPAEARSRYITEWTRVQEEFVDSPERAITDAERLLGRLVRDRGYPDGLYNEQLSALSVHHPRHAHGYRQLHDIAARAPSGSAGTEELREVLVHARALFDDLTAQHRTDKPAHGRGASEPRRPLGERLHTPRIMRRHHESSSARGRTS